MTTTEKQKVTVFVTIRALTNGIQEMTGSISEDGNFYADAWNGGFTKNGYFFTRAEAIKDAEDMRLKKIASLRQNIELLEMMVIK